VGAEKPASMEAGGGVVVSGAGPEEERETEIPLEKGCGRLSTRRRDASDVTYHANEWNSVEKKAGSGVGNVSICSPMKNFSSGFEGRFPTFPPGQLGGIHVRDLSALPGVTNGDEMKDAGHVTHTDPDNKPKETLLGSLSPSPASTNCPSSRPG